jgi:hypothetical protein
VISQGFGVTKQRRQLRAGVERDLAAATGGGPSVIYPWPAWQAQQAPIIGRDARGVPDLSWNAAVNGEVLVWITAFPGYQRSGWHVYGGTSWDMTTGFGSPRAAAFVAASRPTRNTHDLLSSPQQCSLRRQSH